MNKNLLVIIIVIIILIGGYLFLSSRSASSPTTTTKTVQENSQTTTETTDKTNDGALVNYGVDGFSPKTITIKKGTTVTWTNDGSRLMWVASSPHPEHTDYSGFDQLKGVDEGEKYAFTFEKVGQWNYHNHLSPKHFGSVTVE